MFKLQLIGNEHLIRLFCFEVSHLVSFGVEKTRFLTYYKNKVQYTILYIVLLQNFKHTYSVSLLALGLLTLHKPSAIVDRHGSSF